MVSGWFVHGTRRSLVDKGSSCLGKQSLSVLGLLVNNN